MSASRTHTPAVVLIVEDEGIVRMVASDMLEDAGFSTVEAASADAAWDILESRGDIDVLFTDIEMPGSMNGFILAAKVAERWPSIRLVITSGRCRPKANDVPGHGMFVPKPYRAEEVLAAFEMAGRQ